MAYTEDENAGGLDTVDSSTLATGDLAIVGDVSDSNRAKAITIANVDTYLSQTTKTLTNKRITKRVVTTTDDASAVIDVAVTDVYELSAIANATTFTFTGTPTDGQTFIIRYKDAGVAKALTWTGFTAIGVTLPAITTAGKWGYVGVQYNSVAAQYHVLAVTTEA